MERALAYYFTWNTYGSWLPGDRRGWVRKRKNSDRIIQPPCYNLENHAR